MTTIYYEKDAKPDEIEGLSLVIVGYGNQGRSWALNLRDSGLNPKVCVRNDDSKGQAEQDGFDVGNIEDASKADIVCILVPDDVIPKLPITRPEGSLTILASGYCYAYNRFEHPGDSAMIAPRMLGPEVRSCYEEGAGFITAIGIDKDETGKALPRTLAVAKALGGLKEGAIEMTPHQEAVLDLAVEQILSPALTFVSGCFVGNMLEAGIPFEAILTELFLSGEVERNYRLLRTEGFVTQLDHHSPTSQYGQLSRRGRYDDLDINSVMKEILNDITSGKFADEWDAEAESGYQKLKELRDIHASKDMQDMEHDLMCKLGPRANAGA